MGGRGTGQGGGSAGGSEEEVRDSPVQAGPAMEAMWRSPGIRERRPPNGRGAVAARRRLSRSGPVDRVGDECRRRLRPARHLGRAAARAGAKAPVNERFGLKTRNIPTVYPQSLNQRRGRGGQLALYGPSKGALHRRSLRLISPRWQAFSRKEPISATISTDPNFWRQVLLQENLTD